MKFKIVLVLRRNSSPLVRIRLLAQAGGKPRSWAVRTAASGLRIMSMISAGLGPRPVGSDPNRRAFSPYQTRAGQTKSIMNIATREHKATVVKISIVIPCRNERRHIGEFLDSLLRQSFDRDWEVEILVADGMSDDGTREVLRRYIERSPSVQMIDNPGRIVSTGLNAAIAASSGDIIIRMDAHTVYASDYVRQCVDVLQRTGADNVGGPWIARGTGSMGRAIAAAFQSPFCAGGGKSHNPSYEGDADTVYLGCWRRSAFERFGLFDPELVRNQDDELNFRIRRGGGRLFQSPKIESYYTPRSSLGAVFKQYLQYGFWKVAVMRKHGSVASWRHLVPALFVSSIVLGLLLIALSSALDWNTLALFAGAFLGGELTLYALACVAATLPYLGTLEVSALLALPAVIAVHHIAYGTGFLMGLFQSKQSGANNPQTANFFTALTR